MRKTFKIIINDKGTKVGTNLMRQHFSNYIKGFSGASAFRQRLVTSPNLKAMKNELSRTKKIFKIN